MKSGRIIFAVMVLVFLFFELAYAFLVLEVGDHYLAGALIKSTILFLFIFLYSKKINWAKWVLTVLLVLNGAVCLFHGIELENMLFFSISVYSLIFVLCIHRLKILKSSYEKKEQVTD